MERLRSNGQWYLFDPADTPNLHLRYGEDFEDAYNAYILTGRFVGKILASQLWEYICDAQTESGTPFILYHDNVNREQSFSPVLGPFILIAHSDLFPCSPQ